MTEDKMSKERMEECKKAAVEIYDKLEAQNIILTGCGVGWEDDSGLVIIIHIHISEEGKRHELPQSNKGFQIKYAYMDYPTLH